VWVRGARGTVFVATACVCSMHQHLHCTTLIILSCQTIQLLTRSSCFQQLQTIALIYFTRILQEFHGKLLNAVVESETIEGENSVHVACSGPAGWAFHDADADQEEHVEQLAGTNLPLSCRCSVTR
jgi:hypothetical protein